MSVKTLLSAFAAGLLSSSAFCGALIIDHNCGDISKIPPEAIEKARETLKISYGHTSHGSQIVSGMRALMKENPKLYSFGKGPGSLSFIDNTPQGDLGNPNRTDWAQRTRNYLSGPGKDRNVVMWSWCGQAGTAKEADIETYLNLMSDLEKEFPNVKFVYMTGHLDGTGKNGNLNKRNDQIREFCRKNGKTLFDFADIESYDPDGKVNYMELSARDSCDYKDGGATKNWAAEWLKDHPDSKITLPDSAAHSHPLNGAMKGRAFWWMAARLAGWEPKN
jgi:hypothetical protein